MEITEIAEKLVEVEQRSKSNTKRLDNIERQTEAINKLTTSTALMAQEIKTMGGSLNELTTDVKELKAEPGKRWKFVVEKAIYIVVAAVVGFVLARVGL